MQDRRKRESLDESRRFRIGYGGAEAFAKTRHVTTVLRPLRGRRGPRRLETC